jgi:ribonuclease P protein component
LNKERPSGANKVAFLLRKGSWGKSNVTRNRFRRVLREAYRNSKHILPQGYDIVILAKNMNIETGSGIIEKELADVFKKVAEK